MISSNGSRKFFKAFPDDGAVCAESRSSQATEIRKLFKAFMNAPAVRACEIPAEKHELIRKTGYAPVSQENLKSELAKCFTLSSIHSSSDDELLEDVLHLAAASSTDFGVA